MPSDQSSSFDTPERENQSSFADANWGAGSSSGSDNSERDLWPGTTTTSRAFDYGSGDDQYNSREQDGSPRRRPRDDSRDGVDSGQDYQRRAPRYFRRDSRFDGRQDGSNSGYSAYARRQSYSDQGNDYNKSQSISDSSGYNSYGRRYSIPRDAADDYRRESRERRPYFGRSNGSYDNDRPRYSPDSNDYDRGYRGTSYRSAGYRAGYAAEDRRDRFDSPRDARYNSDARTSSAPQGMISDVNRYSNRRDRPYNARSYGEYRSYSDQSSNYRPNGRRDNRSSYRQNGGYNTSPRRPNSYGYEANNRSRFTRRSGYYDFNDRRREPLSLAESLLLKYGKLARTSNLEEVVRPNAEVCSERYRELAKLGTRELVQRARRRGDSEHDLFVQVLRDKVAQASIMYSEGVLELLPDGFGFLRKPSRDYVSSPDDVYVSPNQIRRFGLRSGVTVRGQIRPSKGMEKNFALLRVVSVNGQDASEIGDLPAFLDLVVGRPVEQLRFTPLKSTKKAEEATEVLRAVDKSSPIGFGQRALVVTPSEPEKTSLLYKLANATLANYPEASVVFLLLAKDSEEAKNTFSDPRCEIFSAGDETEATWKLQLANLAFEKAKRLVEFGKDVVVFCDSLPALAQAWKEESGTDVESGRPNAKTQAVQSPRAFLGLARKIDGGGSLTVVAVTQAEDDEVPEEYRGIVDTAIFLKDDSCSVDSDKSYSTGCSAFTSTSESSARK